MKTVEIKDNQTLLDVALQHYGTAEAIGEILTNNPALRNAPSAVVDSGRALGSFYPDIKLEPGTLLIDDDSRNQKKMTVKKIETDITTYMTEKWQEVLRR